MKAYRIHIPQASNEGIPFDYHNHHHVMINKALNDFGGYTFDHAVKQGAWKDPVSGKIYKEYMYQLELATDDYSKVRAFAEFCRELYKQECMYVVTIGKVEFV